MKETQQFSMSREFKAPLELVFEAFTKAEALTKWWGPVEAPIDVISLDFRPGGIFHYRMNGHQIYYGIFHYTEIEAPRRISWINSFANEKGEIIKAPFAGIDLPKEIRNTITLSEKNGITTLLLQSEAINATENEIKTFITMTESMQQGFGGTLNQLEKYLETL